MPRYNVHLYREMRLLFEGIEAGSHEEAAAIARNRLTEDADTIADCDGQTFGALVDVVGDEQYEQSRMIDFEDEQLRKAAPAMLEALEAQELAEWDAEASRRKGYFDRARELRRAALAAARAALRAGAMTSLSLPLASGLPAPFDDYEIHGMKRLPCQGQEEESIGRIINDCEQVSDAEAQFWSLFGHIPGRGLDCIGDFATREHAEEILARITGRPHRLQLRRNR